MTSELVRGGNTPLSANGEAVPASARVVFSWRSTGGPAPVSLMAVACDTQGRALSAEHQVTYGEPSPTRDRVNFVVVVELSAVPPTVPNLVFALVTDDGREAALPDLVASVAVEGREVARYAPADVHAASAMVVLEVYRRGPQWKVRAIGQTLTNGRGGLLQAFALAG
jgi:stress response protein SCP2